ncbi:MAG: AzlC family ABC transporter permease [Burkholderiaceae bacterium]|jgi:4-azaleucine resistance transporter AzlC|nr:AzlC family ABC transporter permease [Burkholderiaceae bacterium]
MKQRAAGVQALVGGVCASFSIVLGYLPIAFSFGVAAVQAGLAPGMAVLASLLVYAGASQFLLVSLLASGAGLWTAIPTVLLMNARHVLYGPAMAAQLPRQRPHAVPVPCLAFGLTDEVFATAMSKMHTVGEGAREHWLFGLQIGAYAAWVGGTFVGVLFVAQVDGWPAAVREGLSFVLPALFFSLLLESGPRHWWRPIVVAAITAAVLLCVLPGYHALALAILAGAFGQVALPCGKQRAAR